MLVPSDACEVSEVFGVSDPNYYGHSYSIPMGTLLKRFPRSRRLIVPWGQRLASG